MSALLEKFIESNRDSNACWEWPHGLSHGYGQVSNAGKTRRVHRVVYELKNGPVPVGMVLDHICRNRKCANPSHLEVVTSGENVLRGECPPAKNAGKLFCKNGHPLSGSNLRVKQRANSDKVFRNCRECARRASRDRDRKIKQLPEWKWRVFP